MGPRRTGLIALLRKRTFASSGSILTATVIFIWKTIFSSPSRIEESREWASFDSIRERET